ncbi:MAG: tryptophan-rich sensory protein [Erythrobacter sp.]|jgi:translocator protein|uniref:TspO/MBR family protein n=1 Tax=Qipengyuania citrea TaxID=225971 RepID=UPI0020A055FC|nr:TspO/MBR family protein [Qipengyuania citrea]MCP2016059.1 tryptophan-rich sensory protein [Qipengyuania citrea]MDE0900132.1 tryptophan-rich sensory protein [Erythrobacter sp.]
MNMLASRGQLRASFIRWALFTVPLCVLLGFVAGQLGGPDTAWFQQLEKPGIYPEPKWFGIVWTILYVMIGLSVAIVASAWGARGRTAALWVFAVHFALNLSWSYVFFGAQQISGALMLLGAIVVTLLVVIALFWRVRRLAALLLLPYLAWVCFATALNYQFLQLNPDADGGYAEGAVERVRI